MLLRGWRAGRHLRPIGANRDLWSYIGDALRRRTEEEGGHVLMYERELLSTEGPSTLLKINQGLSSFGGFFACVILSIWYD